MKMKAKWKLDPIAGEPVQVEMPDTGVTLEDICCSQIEREEGWDEED